VNNYTSIGGDDEDCTCPPPLPPHPLSPLDIIGNGLHVLGGIFWSIQDGIFTLSRQFESAAQYRRDRQERAEANTYYESQFNGIISQATLPEDPS
jgi:hypothetical protein